MTSRLPKSHVAAVLLGTVACFCATLAHAAPSPDPTLSAWRAARRVAVRELSADPAKGTSAFNLLVVPVDFADKRLPNGWNAAADLSPRLAGLDGETLERYFSAVSGIPGWLRIVLSPLVHLDGEAADYSDLYLNGFTRTRALARQSITGAAAAGVPLGSADADGDGVVDGVLVLHAAPGLENDPVNGRVVPLQYYLETPYLLDGIAAQHYAVASLHSGPGIWAHETAHLLGLEDRYDPFLSPDADSAVSLGGLGAFSLMAAGAWGRGDGTGAALLDAYSAAQLGWVVSRQPLGGAVATDTLLTSEVLRFPVDGITDDEYFLLQVRGGFDDAPYDAAFPEPRLVVYHVDESVPDGAYSVGEQSHLRVRLVEADGIDDLAAGESSGGPGDMFPPGAGPANWDQTSIPDSDAYTGPSGIACAFSLVDDGVTVDYSLPGHPLQLELSVTTTGEDSLIAIEILDPSVTAETIAVNVSLFIPLDNWGAFAPGVLSVARDLLHAGGGVWTLSEPIVWLPAGEPPAGAYTLFAIELVRDGETLGVYQRSWLWRQEESPLALSVPLTGGWVQMLVGGDDTRWHAWPANAAPGLPAVPLLACTGGAFEDGASWPDVTYQNAAEARILSPPFHTDGRVLRMIHALDAHAYEPLMGTDGAQVSAHDDEGSVNLLVPAGGYPGSIDSSVANPLLGQPAFIGLGDLTAEDSPRWRIDYFPLPEPEPGLTRLGLHFASDPLWRGRGWLIARMDFVNPASAAAPFAPAWDETRDGVALSWPWETPEWITLEASLDGGTVWTTIWEGGVPFGHAPADMLFPANQLVLPAGALSQHTLLRARVRIDIGEVVSRHGVLVAPTVEPVLFLGKPGPNPFSGDTRFLVQYEGLACRLGVYDLRGRQVREWWLARGTYQLNWDGRDEAGRTVPAGFYLLRLSTHDGSRVFSRKVTLLR